MLDDEELAQIGEAGEEYGVTTGRRRKVNWLNMDKLVKAINVSGTTNAIISKVDILESVDIYKLIYRGELIDFKSIDDMKLNISKILGVECDLLESIKYSSSPQKI